MTWKSKFILLKAYFEKGQGLMSHVKPIFYLVGGIFVLQEDLLAIIILAILWGVVGFVVGIWWDKEGLSLLEQEFSNERNLFVSEMRGKFK